MGSTDHLSFVKLTLECWQAVQGAGHRHLTLNEFYCCCWFSPFQAFVNSRSLAMLLCGSSYAPCINLNFSCIKLHLLIQAYNFMYINDALYISFFIHQWFSKDYLLDTFLTEPKLQSLLNKVFEFDLSLSLSLARDIGFIYRQTERNRRER